MAYAEKRGNGPYPWSGRYRRPDGKWDRVSGFAERDDALHAAQDMESEIRGGRWTDPRKGATPLGEWAAMWMAQQKHSLTTAAKRRRYLDLHILPTFRETPILEINRWAVRTWVAGLTLAPSTRQQLVSFLSTLLTAAVDADMLQSNPLWKLKLSPTELGESQVQALADDEDDVWVYPEAAVPLAGRIGGTNGLLVLTAAFTGMRWGELVGLHRDNCGLLRRDTLHGRTWPRRVIRIDPVVGALHETTEIDAAGAERTVVYIGAPKPPNGAREVDLPEWLADLLAEHLAAWPYDYVFATARGALWRRANWTRIMRPACDGRGARPRRRGTAGMAAWEPLAPGLKMHGLRHGHKTAMQEDGIADVLQHQRMGHEKPRDRRAIGDRYTHITAPMREQLLNALTDRWERSGALETLRAA